MTRQALEAGLHVLVEKPVGIFADEVAEILPVLAERPELVCGVMYNRRAAQAYRHIKIWSQSRTGELVRCSWIITNLYRTEALSHLRGLARYLVPGRRGRTADDPNLPSTRPYAMDLRYAGFVLARCSTIGRPIQVENEAELFLTYLNGAHGHFYCFSP